jgi:DNA-binding transcriptional regulator YdaS (Cro superfamily)
MNQAIDKAIELAGSKTALARLLTEKRVKESNGSKDVTPISRQNVDYWRNVNLPARVAVDIEIVTASRVTRYELLPDIFGPKP